MAWYPKAIRREVTKHRTPMAEYRRLILHTAVSSSASLFDWHQKVSHASHFYLRHTGVWEQYVDTRYRAPNQMEGNHDAISVESQDMGGPFPSWGGSNVPQWTAAQVEAIAELAVWCNEMHGIPLVRLPNSRPGTRGIGWHRQGIDGNFPDGLLAGRVSGGETWSQPGKVCPGDRRILQIPGIITRANQLGEGDDMPTADEVATAVMAKLEHWNVPIFHDGRKDDGSWPTERLDTLLGRVRARTQGTHATVPALAGEMAGLVGEVAGLAELVRQLAAAPSVPLTPEQLTALTAAVTQAAAGAAEQALERTRLVVDET